MNCLETLVGTALKMKEWRRLYLGQFVGQGFQTLGC